MSSTDVNAEAAEFEDSDEDQLDAASERGRLSQAVIGGSDWTTETILNQLQRGNVDMNPRFQRRDAWTVTRKSKFIESLILGLPVPQIVLAERKGHRGQYIVLDGKQRLLSLLQFRGAAIGSKHNEFPLTGLEVLAELEGFTYKDVAQNLLTREQHTAFMNQDIRAILIKNWPDFTFLHLVFLRLNTGSVKLSPQELRQAMFPGEFSNLVDDAAISSEALKLLLKLDAPDFRMRDVELMVRFLAFQNFMADYRGSVKAFLDDTCLILNRDWMDYEKTVAKQVSEFEQATEALAEVFGPDGVARRPEGSGRRPFNRAIFDVQAYYFARKSTRDAALRKKVAVRRAFDHLWANDAEFVRSVETTTKSMEATHTRFAAWGKALARVLGKTLKTPRLVENRLRP